MAMTDTTHEPGGRFVSSPTTAHMTDVTRRQVATHVSRGTLATRLRVAGAPFHDALRQAAGGNNSTIPSQCRTLCF